MGVPGNANTLLLKSAAAGGGAYQVSRSLRFNSGDSAYLSRTPGSAGNRKTWTWAAWIKRSKLTESDYVHLFGHVNSAGSVFTNFIFKTGSDSLQFFGNSSSVSIETANLLRDASAWYHLILAVDTTQATASNRAKIYINGVEAVYATDNRSSTISQNADLNVNNAVIHEIGGNPNLSATRYFNGYLADIHFIDGQALEPSSFTETDATTGQLIPKAYTGSYGTNGFRLAFDSYATTAALGTDTSGNGNTWTVNNFSVTAGVNNDSTTDTPTSYGTGNSGGDVRGNYSTWNPLANPINATTFSNGNLEFVGTSGSHSLVRSSIAASSGKWYAEFSLSAVGGNYPQLGILDSTISVTQANPYLGQYANGYALRSDGQKENNNNTSAYGSSFTTGDIIGVAFDADNGTLTYYKNGTSQGTAYSSIPAGSYLFAATAYNSGGWIANWGQRAFAYTAPSGFKALVDTNLPTPVVAKPGDLFDVKLYTGNGSTNTITGLGFSPDLVWAKSRSVGNSHHITDVVRGVEKALSSDYTGAENWAGAAGDLTAFTSDGFTMRQSATWDYNGSGKTYVAWAWDAGTTTVSNTQGSITSQVRANPTAGFSVLTYTGTGPSATIGHGLGVAPGLVIVKRRDASGPVWAVYHSALGPDKILQLQTTDAAGTYSGYWGSPNSTTFGIISGSDIATGGGTYVAYCFAPVSGYSSMGSWQHNNSSDGPFIYTGFRPKFILIKNTDNVEQWYIFDSARRTYNISGTSDTSELRPNTSAAEGTLGLASTIDFLSNGFKIRGAGELASGTRSYIYACFAESPFAYSRAR